MSLNKKNNIIFHFTAFHFFPEIRNENRKKKTFLFKFQPLQLRTTMFPFRLAPTYAFMFQKLKFGLTLLRPQQ